MKLSFESLDPGLTVKQLDMSLSTLDHDKLWRWNLAVQDKLILQYEMNFLDQTSFLGEGRRILDISWGREGAIASRIETFRPSEVTEVGLTLDYLFSGNTKGKQILRDVAGLIDSSRTFNGIRLCLVAQMIRHHGVLLRGLSQYLEEDGFVLIIDCRDNLLDFSRKGPHLKGMYDKLADLQKTTGGVRDGAERIQKRASTFGFRLLESQEVRSQTRDKNGRLAFFQMFCLHVEIITRVFPGHFDRGELFAELKKWYDDPRSWASIGLHFVLIQKKRKRALRRKK